jgi:hypothetical protein
VSGATYSFRENKASPFTIATTSFVSDIRTRRAANLSELRAKIGRRRHEARHIPRSISQSDASPLSVAAKCIVSMRAAGYTTVFRSLICPFRSAAARRRSG